MTVFDSFKIKTIDEIAEWLDEYITCDDAPWLRWWDNNYCKECMMEAKESETVWCESNGNCKFFKDQEEIPSMKEIIKMWLESEVDVENTCIACGEIIPEGLQVCPKYDKEG